jgi:hypothetical protein
MPYYPKSRIIEDQKANPDQFITADGKSYSGPYYTTFDGKTFTGKNPNDGTSRPLLPTPKTQDLNPNLSYSQDAVKFRTLSTNAPATLIDPTPYTPVPTVLDYKAGKITRYIARQRNGTQFKVMEISKQTHENLINLRGGANSSLWKSVAIFWQISGPLRNEKINNITTRAGIIDTNQRILDTTEKNFIGIKQYLSDLQQFAKVS